MRAPDLRQVDGDLVFQTPGDQFQLPQRVLARHHVPQISADKAEGRVDVIEQVCNRLIVRRVAGAHHDVSGRAFGRVGRDALDDRCRDQIETGIVVQHTVRGQDRRVPAQNEELPFGIFLHHAVTAKPEPGLRRVAVLDRIGEPFGRPQPVETQRVVDRVATAGAVDLGNDFIALRGKRRRDRGNRVENPHVERVVGIGLQNHQIAQQDIVDQQRDGGIA